MSPLENDRFSAPELKFLIWDGKAYMVPTVSIRKHLCMYAHAYRIKQVDPSYHLTSRMLKSKLQMQHIYFADGTNNRLD